MSKPFIIMLDLDGPLCNHRSLDGVGDCYDPVSVGMLIKLCATTGAQIVIISARRRNADLPDKLKSLGLGDYLFPDTIHWRTGFDKDGIRGNEIDAWHAANPGYDYAIIDDERSGLKPHHIQRLVHVDMHAGLSLGDILKVKRLMGQDVSDQDIDSLTTQSPRISIAQMAKDALKAIDQGDDDGARIILDMIASHPLAL